MSLDLEVETEELREAIHEELEREGNDFIKQISLTTAMLAAFIGVAALLSGSTINEALMAKTEAATLQEQSSNLRVGYRERSITREIQELERAIHEAANRTSSTSERANEASDAQKAIRDQNEQKQIERRARELDTLRDQRSYAADHLLRAHRGYANALALLQVSIVLGAVAAVGRNRFLWYGSMAVGSAGICLFALTFLR
jgi:hypothetical protein